MNRALPTFVRQRMERVPELRLFCLPCAGGSAAAFRPWSRVITSSIQVCPLELPGHGSRIKEPPTTSMPELVGELVETLDPFLDAPFALLGHSMGSAIAWHLARALEHRGGPVPRRLIVMGFRPLHFRRPQPLLHRLDDQGLTEALRAFGGTPQEVLEQPQLMSLMLPAIRADFELIETLATPTDLPLACGLSAYMGSTDREVSFDQMEQWRQYTSADFQLRIYPGGHFFPWSQLDPLVEDLETDLGFRD